MFDPRWQVAAALGAMAFYSAVLGHILAATAIFRQVYLAAGMSMPPLLNVLGRAPWAFFACIVVPVAGLAVVAWRSRQPAIWLTIEAAALAALASILVPLITESAYAPIRELTALLQK